MVDNNKTDFARANPNLKERSRTSSKITPTYPWEQFKELFNVKYSPSCWKVKKSREFRNLKQTRTMIETQYKAEIHKVDQIHAHI